MNLSGFMNDSGVLTGTFSDNSLLAPNGTQWNITLCPQANVQCSTGLTAIIGSSANLSTLFSSYTKPIRIPAAWNAYMYADTEIYPIPIPGGRYWNVTSQKLRCWNSASPGWVDCGGGTFPVGPGLVQTNSSGVPSINSPSNPAPSVTLQNTFIPPTPTPLTYEQANPIINQNGEMSMLPGSLLTDISTTATVTATSAYVTVASATGIVDGQQVLGFPAATSTFVNNVAGTTLTLSNIATTSGTGVPLQFIDPNCYMWFASLPGATSGTVIYTTLAFMVAGDATCSSYLGPGSDGAPPLYLPFSTGIRFPYVYTDATDSNIYLTSTYGPSVGSVYAQSATKTSAPNGGVFSVLNGGTPIITQGADPYAAVANTGFVFDRANNKTDMFIEAWPASGYVNDAIQYSYATVGNWSQFDANKTTTPIIPGGSSPDPILVPDHSGIILLHGQFTPNISTGVIDGSQAAITAHCALTSTNLALAASWWQGNFWIKDNGRFTDDPSMAVFPGKTNPIIIDYLHALPTNVQWDMYQTYSSLTLDDFWTQVCGGGAPTQPASAQNDTTNASNMSTGVVPSVDIPATVSVWQKYTLTLTPAGRNSCPAGGNLCWQVTNLQSQRETFTANVAVLATNATQQDVVIDQLPANSYLTNLKEQTLLSCSGSGLTSIYTTIGTSVDDTFFYALPYDLMAAVGGTNFAPSSGNLTRSGTRTNYGDTLVLGINTIGGNVSAIQNGCEVELFVSYTGVPQ
jgi:hypothetical protein